MRQIVLVGFLQAQNCTNLVSSWRHPDSRSDFTSPAYYQKICSPRLEAGPASESIKGRAARSGKPKPRAILKQRHLYVLFCL